jgi:hypothetical protein
LPPGYPRANRQTPHRLKRLLLPFTAFIRSGRRFARKHPQAASSDFLPTERAPAAEAVQGIGSRS